MNEAYLIRNTTPEERERIVLEALSGGDDCDKAVTDADIALYQPYIDGRLELNECTRAYRTGYVLGAMEQPKDSGCGWAR